MVPKWSVFGQEKTTARATALPDGVTFSIAAGFMQLALLCSRQKRIPHSQKAVGEFLWFSSYAIFP